MSSPPPFILSKPELERALYAENQSISSGRLKDENPLDTSPLFHTFCESCRRGDLKATQEMLSAGKVDVNGRDEFDYTPLILASLCGHFETVRLLLESGARCERDTFQGERCLYNALNDRIRNLLLSYDYSKSSDPLQPLAAHISALVHEEAGKTSDIVVHTEFADFALHKFILSARSPYFRRKLGEKPSTTSWRLKPGIPTKSFETCVRWLYLGDVGQVDFGTAASEEDQAAILAGIDKLSRLLEIPSLWDGILQVGDRRQARQRRTDDLARGRDQLREWFDVNIVAKKFDVEKTKIDEVQWARENAVFADVLLQADDESDDAETTTTLYPAHRALLTRSEFFAIMFASPFREASNSTTHLQIIPIACSAAVLEIILTYLYTESADFSLAMALQVLEAADMLFIEKLKQRAALLISTLGNGSSTEEGHAEDEIDPLLVLRLAWSTRVPRLEEFSARFLAYRLERFIDLPEFESVVRESAARIRGRQETDTVELVDDIRYYLSERFRLRFEDAGLDELLDENAGKEESKSLNDKSTEADGREALRIAEADSTAAMGAGVVRTLDGEVAGDEFAQDALNYQILLGKIETLMEGLGLDG